MITHEQLCKYIVAFWKNTGNVNKICLRMESLTTKIVTSSFFNSIGSQIADKSRKRLKQIAK